MVAYRVITVVIMVFVAWTGVLDRARPHGARPLPGGGQADAAGGRGTGRTVDGRHQAGRGDEHGPGTRPN